MPVRKDSPCSFVLIDIIVNWFPIQCTKVSIKSFFEIERTKFKTERTYFVQFKIHNSQFKIMITSS